MNRSLLVLRAAASLSAFMFTGLAGCQTGARAPEAPASKPSSAARPAQKVAVVSRDLKANEVGRIPILMYHSIGQGGRYDRRGLNISAATFRKQLEMMYAANWYPMNMRDVLTPRMDVPAGKTPVVLTFDDARGSQFRYLKDGRIDPNCAVGIMEAFHAKHPDWPERASFYVLPRSKWNPVPFWQPGKERQKLQFLVQHGYEVANHSVSHRFMSHMDANTLRWEMAGCVKAIRALAPGATMDTMALPYGAAPRNHALWSCLLRGQVGGVSYENRCILLAGGDPAYPPTSRKFDPKRIMRVSAEPGYIETYIRDLKAHRLFQPYVSDGNPDVVTVPRKMAAQVNPKLLAGEQLVVYGNAPAPKKMAADKMVVVRARKVRAGIRPQTPAKPGRRTGGRV